VFVGPTGQSNHIPASGLVVCQRNIAAELNCFSISRSINPGRLCTRLRATVAFHGELEIEKSEMREIGLEWTEAKSVLHTPFTTTHFICSYGTPPPISYVGTRNCIICYTNTSNVLLDTGIVFQISRGTHV
jgi:hypothetical protein